MESRQRVSEILAQGTEGALTELMPIVYDELRQLASAYLARERAGHTLQPTALANEAYMRLVDSDTTGLNGRAHFFAVAARAMRQVLVDHARKKQALKRGGDRNRLSLSMSDMGAEMPWDVLDLEEALTELAQNDERKARVVELRFFAGLQMKTIAEMLGLSPKTVEADWYMARAWLKTRMA